MLALRSLSARCTRNLSARAGIDREVDASLNVLADVAQAKAVAIRPDEVAEAQDDAGK
jgi:hypothetical protein